MFKVSRFVAPAVGLVVFAAGATALADERADERADNPAGGAATDRIFDMPYLMRDLDNGLRVVIVPTDYPDIVTIQIPVQTGSRNEVEPGKSGFAHFFEHMMFRGTKKYPAKAYKSILQNAGADQNAYTTDDYTNYHITFTKADLEKVIEIEADRFRNLSYSEEQFRTEALAVRGEYLKNFSNPLSKMLERLRDKAFDVHTYKHTTMGFFEDIEDMPNQLEYSRTFFDRWYRPENTAVILVGDVDPEETFELVRKHWGGWEPGAYRADIPVEPPPRGPVFDHIVWEQPTQPWVVLAFRGPRFDPRNKAMAAMDLISELYFSETSELYRSLVIEEQKVDQLFTYFPDRKDPNLLTIAARLMDVGHAVEVEAAIKQTLARARAFKVEPSRLEATKSNLRYAFAAQLDSSGSIGAMLASYMHFERDPETVNEVYRRYAELTADDLAAYANTYFTDSGLVTLTLANAEALDGIGEGPSIAERVAAVQKSQATPALRLVTLPAPTSPLIDVALLFEAGAAYDPPGKKGLAHLTAAMVTGGGSSERTIEEINEARYPLAAGFGGQVDKEMTRFGGSVHRDNLKAWYALMREQLLTPGWREEDFERIRQRTINAIRTDLVGNNDEELGKEALYGLIYGPGHPYGTLTLGAVEDLQRITLDDVREFYATRYTRASLTVGLAGGFDDELVAMLREDLQALPEGRQTKSPALPEPAPAQAHSALVIEKETPGVAVSFGFPIELTRGDPDWVALWLARSWLGEHRSSNSHLYQRIRETRGMNYGDYAYIEYFPRGMFQFHPDPNLGRRQQIFQVWLRPLRDNNDAHFATRAAVYELDKLIEEGLSEEEFERTRNFLDKFVSLLTATQSRQLGYRLDSEYYDVPPFAEYVREGLAGLTAEKVNRVIREHLQTDNMHFVFITADGDDLRQRLVDNSASPLEYNTPKPGLAAEDEAIATLPLRFDGGRIEVLAAEQVFSASEAQAFARLQGAR